MSSALGEEHDRIAKSMYVMPEDDEVVGLQEGQFPSHSGAKEGSIAWYLETARFKPGSRWHMEGSTLGPEPQYLYLCINAAARHCIKMIRCDTLHDDLEFFAALKSTYDLTRENLRWFSIWRYDHCEFYVLLKHQSGRLVRVRPCCPGLPPTDGRMYDFKPRATSSEGSHGLISAEEFNKWYYCSREEMHWSPELLRTSALESMPKRLKALDLEDRKSRCFYGLLAVEKMCPYRVVLYCVLWGTLLACMSHVWGNALTVCAVVVPLYTLIVASLTEQVVRSSLRSEFGY